MREVVQPYWGDKSSHEGCLGAFASLRAVTFACVVRLWSTPGAGARLPAHPESIQAMSFLLSPTVTRAHALSRADLAAARCNLREARDGAAMRLRAVPGERPAARTWVWVPAVT